MIADKIKMLREENNISQATLAKKLGITRSSVNAWEMGISVPSTQYVIELASLFHVSTDFLLCMPQNKTVDVSGLTDEDVKVVYPLILHLKNKNKN